MPRAQHTYSLILSMALAFLCHGLNAQEVEYSESYLDTVQLKKVFLLNDYTSVGVEYGPSASMTLFNPSKKQSQLYNYQNYAFYITKYTKMFGYMPYLALKMGVRYSTEGYQMKQDKETGRTPDVDGATSMMMKVVDLPMMAMLHVDATHFSGMVNVGIYGGYRLDIQREGNRVPPAYVNDFYDYEHRFDYGLTGGLGFALVFAPFEFQINANCRYSWCSLYDPDYSSEYYYRFAYPLDFTVTAGIYYHLTRRTGKTRPQIRREARNNVYGEQNK